MSNKGLKSLLAKISRKYNKNSIRYMIFLSFTLTAIIAVLLTGITFYVRFSQQIANTTLEENQILVNQANQSLTTFLRNTNGLANSLAYNVVKNTDFETETINEQLILLHNTYTNSVESIAVYSSAGELLATAPAAIARADFDVREQEWFTKALDKTENFHYSPPTVQRLFESATDDFSWVVSLSCSVEVTQGKDIRQGVLLIDLKYDAISELFSNITLANNGYIYLVDETGDIIYHPKQQLIATGMAEENNLENAQLREGTYTDTFDGETRTVIVKQVGYTGWKVIGVIPQGGLTFDAAQNTLFILIIFFLYLGALTMVNAYISSKLTNPIQKLERSVQKLEQGVSEAKIYSGGSYEIQHLGRSIQKMVDQMRRMTDQMVREHDLKRINELNALQAQINPHFLYNTLDIIVWMIEREQPEKAVRIVTALARFFRISLSKGKNIITVADELEHVRNYLTIQDARYKDKFVYHINASDEVLSLATIKLVVQPIVENAIYHGMDYMDGDGIIDIDAYLDRDLYIRVRDNGLGMQPDTIEKLLTNEGPSSASGSGIGLKNVDERIKLYFGENYGVVIESEPDVGTTITLRLPAIPYDEMEDKAHGAS